MRYTGATLLMARRCADCRTYTLRAIGCLRQSARGEQKSEEGVSVKLARSKRVADFLSPAMRAMSVSNVATSRSALALVSIKLFHHEELAGKHQQRRKTACKPWKRSTPHWLWRRQRMPFGKNLANALEPPLNRLENVLGTPRGRPWERRGNALEKTRKRLANALSTPWKRLGNTVTTLGDALGTP